MSTTRRGFIAGVAALAAGLLGLKPKQTIWEPQSSVLPRFNPDDAAVKSDEQQWSPRDILGGCWFSADDPSTFEVDSRGRVSRMGSLVQPVQSKRPQLGPWP